MSEFTEHDIHYLTGFLYLVANTTQISVTLGERVFDVGSESKRDVDVVVVLSENTGIIAAEVKDHSEKLDSGHIDALCTKFNDMPCITDRYIVSTSGYTEPALKKAKYHNIKCLTMKTGILPAFKNYDVSKIKEMSVMHHTWIEGPITDFVPDDSLPESFDHLVNKSTIVVYGDKGKTINAQEVADAVARKMNGWIAPPKEGEYKVETELKVIGYKLKICDHLFPVLALKVRGTIKVTDENLPLDQSKYLVDIEGNVIAGAAVVESRGCITGICLSPNNDKIYSFHLPESLRKIRPHKVELE